MTTQYKIKVISELKFKFENVLSVYSGKKGCACGCNGKYSYSSHGQKESGESRGYSVDDNEVSDRSVKIIMGKFQKVADENNIIVHDNERFIAGQVFYLENGLFTFDTDTRTYIMKLRHFDI